MPLEVKELVVKVTVGQSESKANRSEKIDLKSLQKKIVQECVDKVLEKLENKFQR